MDKTLTRRLFAAGLAAPLVGCTTLGADALSETVQVNLTRSSLPPPPPAVVAEGDGSLRSGIDAVRRMTVEAMINETGPYSFVVDTGANRTVLAAEIADQLGLQSSGQMAVHGIAGVLPAYRVDVRRLDVGEVVSRRVRMPVLPRRYLGADGLLGVDVLARRRATLDFAGQSFHVTGPGAQAVGTRTQSGEGTSLSEIVVPARQRFGQLTIVDAELGGVPLTAFLDSGAEITVGNSVLRNQVLSRPGLVGGGLSRIELVSATGQLVAGELAVVPPLRLGGVRLGNLSCVFADLHTFALWQLTDRPAMLIGVDVMRHFDSIELDFSRSKVSFRSRRFNRSLSIGS
ncbi:retroviral-like aspartic protease family protein [Caulobacter mirabilis]|nr:retroviral-like aspartic protease family protein [Caulobacter mirabilis]